MQVNSAVQRDMHGVEYAWCRMVGDGRVVEIALKGNNLQVRAMDGDEMKLILDEGIPKAGSHRGLRVYRNAQDLGPKNGEHMKDEIIEVN